MSSERVCPYVILLTSLPLTMNILNNQTSVFITKFEHYLLTGKTRFVQVLEAFKDCLLG